jgi:hypothetical protein
MADWGATSKFRQKARYERALSRFSKRDADLRSLIFCRLPALASAREVDQNKKD